MKTTTVQHPGFSENQGYTHETSNFQLITHYSRKHFPGVTICSPILSKDAAKLYYKIRYDTPTICKKPCKKMHIMVSYNFRSLIKENFGKDT